MKETLTQKDREAIAEFSTWLGTVTGPDDLFPPGEDTGVRQPNPRPRPTLPPLCRAVGETMLAPIFA